MKSALDQQLAVVVINQQERHEEYVSIQYLKFYILFLYYSSIIFYCNNTLSGLPTQEELLIFALGLGGSGNNYNPINRPPPDSPGPGGDGAAPQLCVSCYSPHPDNNNYYYSR